MTCSPAVHSPPAPNPPRHPPAGYTLAELLMVITLLGLVVALAVPRLSLGGVRTDGAVQEVGGALLAAQRAAVTRQHPVVVAFDAAGRRLRLHFDADADGTMDTGELVRFTALPEGVVFGRGAAPAAFVGAGPVAFTRMQGTLPAVTFFRNGIASEEGGVYLTSRRAAREGGRATDARLVTVDRATGRASWFSYTGAQWTREF